MIEKLKLIGFQAHTKTEIEFGKGVTSIIGPTDSGKSSIIRALKWCILNQNFSKAWINRKRKNAIAILTVDGTKVKRAQGSKGNRYALDAKEFSAFGVEVPNQIKDHLKMSELNFQDQHDSPFWFGASAGEVSRELNQIVDLGVIDQALAYVSTTLRDNKSKVDVSSERLLQARQKVKELKHVREMDEDLVELENLANEYQTTETKHGNLMRMLSDLEFYQKDAKSKVPDISKLDQGFEELNNLELKVYQLKMLLQKIRDAKRENKSQANQLVELEEELGTITGGICPLCGNELHE